MDRLAIFDLDGTLLDTIEDLADAGNYALGRHGLPTHPVEPYKHFVGDGLNNLIRRALPADRRDDGELAASVRRDFDAYYSAHSQDKTRPYPGVVQALQDLNKAGLGVGVFSNKPHGYAVHLVGQYFPGLVQVTYGQRDDFPRKPDPTVVLAMIGEMGGTAGACCYIGDTGTDMMTGKNAGLYTIGVAWGFRTKDELEKTGADVIIDKPEELVKIIVDNTR